MSIGVTLDDDYFDIAARNEKLTAKFSIAQVGECASAGILSAA
jgi:hypothetical protein